MKNYRIVILPVLILLILLSAAGSGYSQKSVNSANVLTPSGFQERLLISTDRDLYITGEQVWCKIYKINGLTNAPSDLSRIIYLELLDDSDIPVVQLKIWAEGTSGSARFRVPDALTSGNYILRAYTSWMQNYPEDLYSFKTISVINPFKDIDKLILSSPGKPVDTASLPVGRGQIVTGAIMVPEIKSSLVIKADPGKKVYGPREKVSIGITVYGTKGNPVASDLSVSVVKTFLLDNERDNLLSDVKENNFTSGIPIISRLPEPEGELIRGVIKSTINDEPLRNTGISLSFVGKSSRCQFGTTNKKGEFIFVVRELYGLNEMVIQPVVHDGSSSYVELVQPFSSSFKINKPDQFHPDTSRIDDINKAIIAMQVTGIYEPSRKINKENPAGVLRNDFFGKPARAVKLDDYIELTNVREVVKEILNEVSLERRNKEYILKVLSSNPYEEFKNQALILVDGVPFFDVGKLLDVSSKEIERVDILNTRYFYSGYIFEGIISFVTRKGNLSALESDNSVYRLVFEGCRSPADFYTPDYTDQSSKDNRIPDFRNTLYWNPELTVSAGGKTFVEFFTSDEPGEYTIKVEGIDSEGNPGLMTVPFQVK